MAKVYLAVQESFDRDVAIKIMAPHLSATDSTYGERFLREARIVAKLSHPHIVSVYDVGVHDGLHYLSMEYIPGQDLKHKRQSMSLAQNVRAVKEIALALDFAHKKGYVHRDIKPENILIHEEDGRAVLTDFGIARMTGLEENLTQTGVAIGTPSYMSPEHALGKAIDHRSDLYSLGVVLFYLVAGRVPFSADSAVAVGLKHAVEPVPRLEGALILFQPILEKILAKQPDKRFQTGKEFADVLNDIVARISPEMESLWRESLNKNSGIAQADKTVATPTGVVPPNSANLRADSAAQKKRAEETLSSEARDPTRLTRLSDAPKRGDQAANVSVDFDLRSEARTHAATPAKKNTKSGLWISLIVLGVSAFAAWKFGVLENVLLPPSSTKSVAQEPQNAQQSRGSTQKAQEITKTPSNDLPSITQSEAQPPSTGVKDAALPPIESGKENAGVTPEAASTQKQEMAQENPPEISSAVTETSADSALNDLPPTALTEEEKKAQQIAEYLGKAKAAVEAGALAEPLEDNAEKWLRETLTLDAQNSEAKEGLVTLGIALAQRGIERVKDGDLKEASTDYERALNLAPRDKDVQVLRQRLDAAQREQDAMVYVRKAEEAIKQNKFLSPEKDNAYVHYQKALSIHPANKTALKGRKNLEGSVAKHIDSLWNKKDFTGASALFALAGERYPDSEVIKTVGEKTILAPKIKQPSAEEMERDMQRALDEEVAQREAELIANAPPKPAVPLLRVNSEVMSAMPETQAETVALNRTLHARLSFNYFTASSTVLMARLYDGSRAMRLSEVPVIVRGSEGEVSFVINRMVEGFPEGAYILDIMLADERLTSVSFVVAR